MIYSKKYGAMIVKAYLFNFYYLLFKHDCNRKHTINKFHLQYFKGQLVHNRVSVCGLWPSR